MPIKLLSWNVAKRVVKLPKQVESIAEQAVDLLALQEVSIKTAELFRTQLKTIGFKYISTSFDTIPNAKELIGPRRAGVLIASRWPIKVFKLISEIPWQEKVLSTIIDSPYGDVELHTAYIPNGSQNGWIKIDTFMGIYKALATTSERHRVLCGDFNAPQLELPDGTVHFYDVKILEDGSVKRGKTFRGRPNIEWGEGEKSVILDLASYDLADTYRHLHGYKKFQYSHIVRGKNKKRYDHTFASNSLNVTECDYLHEFLESKLSDHSGMYTIFSPK